MWPQPKATRFHARTAPQFPRGLDTAPTTTSSFSKLPQFTPQFQLFLLPCYQARFYRAARATDGCAPARRNPVQEEKQTWGDKEREALPPSRTGTALTTSSSAQADTGRRKGTHESPAGIKASSLTSSMSTRPKKAQGVPHRVPPLPHKHVHNKIKSVGFGCA